MKWKLKPGEIITYKAYMKESDSTKSKLSFGNMFDGKDGDPAKNTDNGMQQMLQQMQSLTPEYYNVSLTEYKKGVIDVEMFAKKGEKKKGDTAQTGFAQLMNAMSSGPVLRGAVREDGSIKSFYLKGEQLNILALFFQLPAKPVKVGEEWQLDTHFISADQSFKCDSSFSSNKVKVTDIETLGDDKVVTLSYNIAEYAGGSFSFPFAPPGIDVKKEIPSVYQFAFKAVARFSIAKGRWLSYEGKLESSTTGMVQSQSTQRYALVP